MVTPRYFAEEVEETGGVDRIAKKGRSQFVGNSEQFAFARMKFHFITFSPFLEGI